MKITILTLFPEMFQTPLNHGIFKRATEKGVVVIEIVNFRDFAKDKHRKVDDYPYGGGAGLILKPEPIFSSVEDVEPGYVVYLSPQGKILNQNKVEELAQKSHLILLCGHYEGVDERVRTALVDEEISIGDYILSGGEIPALVLTDAVVRLLPDVLGNKGSLKEESFADGLLEYPQYTRPAEYKGMKVPNILVSGNHALIAKWRRQQALKKTKETRPDLWEKLSLKKDDLELLEEEIEVPNNN
jgi:tRNA (guanine37-N1)-methyltransferase